jgi:hypothetical protein
MKCKMIDTDRCLAGMLELWPSVLEITRNVFQEDVSPSVRGIGGRYNLIHDYHTIF